MFATCAAGGIKPCGDRVIQAFTTVDEVLAHHLSQDRNFAAELGLLA